MKKTILDKLNELGDQITWNVPDINKGGCGVFAALAGRRILDLQVEVLGCVVDGDCTMRIDADTPSREIQYVRTDIDTLRPMVKNPWCAYQWWAAGLVMKHVGLELCIEGELYIFDSLGVFKPEDHPHFPHLVPGRLSLIEIGRMALDSGRGWCDDFDREQIPFVKDIVEAFLPLPDSVRRREKFRAKLRKRGMSAYESWLFPMDQLRALAEEQRQSLKEQRDILEALPI